MRLLDRYLLRELLIPFAYCLGGFLIFCIAFDLFSEMRSLQNQKLHGIDILLYYCVKTPELLVTYYVLPVALLLALLYTLTNLARHHEITAIRGAGISLWRLGLPYLGVGLATTALLFVLNEFCVPGSSERAERIRNRRIQPQSGPADSLISGSGLVNLREGRTWLAGDYNPATSEMRNAQVLCRLRDGSELWLMAARAARVRGVWTFFDVREYRSAPETGSMLAPSLRTNVLAMPQFKETPEEIQSEINLSRGMSLQSKAKADIPITQILGYLRLHPEPPDAIKAWLGTKLQGRLATPWTCLVVVLIAMPFGAASGRRNIFVGVASSILICFIFFVLQQLGLALGTGGRLAPWLAAWFPNLSFSLAGIWMTARVR
jgi:lipopolysaccharide export system permease protein